MNNTDREIGDQGTRVSSTTNEPSLNIPGT